MPSFALVLPTQDDLICLPAKLASSLGSIGPLVLCSRVTSSITLLDPITLRTAVMDAPVYWRTPFKAMLTSRSLVEYIVLDIEPLHGGGAQYGGSSSGSSGKWCLAEAQVARKSDFGRNDTVFFARTHLGNILHPGKCFFAFFSLGSKPSSFAYCWYWQCARVQPGDGVCLQSASQRPRFNAYLASDCACADLLLGFLFLCMQVTLCWGTT